MNNKTPIQELIEEIKESCIQDYFSANADQQSKLIVSVCNNIIKKAEEKLPKEKENIINFHLNLMKSGLEQEGNAIKWDYDLLKNEAEEYYYNSFLK